MVLAERNSELVRNGRRSRGPSPNGHGVGVAGGGTVGASTNIGNSGGAGGTGTPETSSDDDNSIKRNGKSKAKQSEYEEKIRVGRDYQAVCPPLIPENDRKPEGLNDRALLVWSPTREIPDAKLEEYISVAKEKYGYNGEQALGMLFWHKHDLERAVMDLANFTPFPDEWTVEDKVLFEQAFQFHGKSFHRIRQMLPDKSIASLVKYYYSWKKTRHRQSVMDRQEKAKASKEGSENGSENGSNEESDTDDKVQLNKQNISALKRKNSEGIDDMRPAENTNRINSRWSNDEALLVVQGVRKYGKDFQTIAETIGTKTEAHVRTFFVSNRRRYNLDQELKKYEAEKEEAAATATASATASETINSNNKKDESKKREPSAANATATGVSAISSVIADESDNTTSSEATVTKSTKDESKLNNSNANLQKDNVIMEIDLDADQNDMQPPAKKFALNINEQDFAKASAI
ncbi:PREDICTED: REST corepressor isoform X2 [Bactrocera latifrons]|uniref:REST corepressor isoform X2 n=1 Tax=Bactrocera latifrons TaxID=174628 RepID=UPI0008DDE18B|nr:PREDICTED: REST corepressor isoform X2 [Bactrocera latifrons]